MCLIAVALNEHPRFPLVLLANRDEFHHRPATPSDWWSSATGDRVLGGRDEQAGGTWMAVNASGHLAALTNIRQPGAAPGQRSRGLLVLDALAKRWQDIVWSDFASFNLIKLQPAPCHARSSQQFSDTSALGPWQMEYRDAMGRDEHLVSGVHGLSNAGLNTPWPKTNYLKQALGALLSRDSLSLVDLVACGFDALSHRQTWPDDQLPDTGVPIEWERLLSACLIVSPDYGTRCSTLVVVDESACLHWQERSYLPDGAVSQVVHHQLKLDTGHR